MNELNIRAKALWDACPTVKPDWDQLGDVTQGVWREKALAEMAAEDRDAMLERTAAADSGACDSA